MKYLDLTLSSPAQNLAWDEALLDWQEDKGVDEILRVWEPQEYFVVLGYANKAHSEARLELCRQKNVPVFRRCTGGGAVLQGPGCLNYTLILKIPESNGGIKETNFFVMKRQKEATRIALMSDSMPDRDSVCQPRPRAHSPDPSLEPKVEIQGSTDLTLDELKFSGNSQRRKRRYLLFHGTFLLNFDLDRIEELLPMPGKRPDYRGDRPHLRFLTNLKLPSELLKQALKETWNASEPATWPEENVKRLARGKYATEEWNFKF